MKQKLIQGQLAGPAGVVCVCVVFEVMDGCGCGRECGMTYNRDSVFNFIMGGARRPHLALNIILSFYTFTDLVYF